ncbi:MAG: hypothetical protein EDM74_06715 [Armatimonadetes bacterium]|nr:MAG: hypothetical protein EDM74_06715 [Armatimonadota bacterium]
MNRITWLHFSDVHYYEKRYGWDANRIFDAFIADLQSLHAEHRLIPDLVFFTGDAVYGHMGSLGYVTTNDPDALQSTSRCAKRRRSVAAPVPQHGL